MKAPVDVVKGRIVDVDQNGNVTIVAHYDDWFTLTKRGYSDCYVELIDSRQLSDKQRRMCWALIGEIAEWQGDMKSTTGRALERDFVNEARKLDFLISELGENVDRIFSLSNAPMSLVAAYQRYLIRFIVYNDIPTKKPMLDYVDDISDYVYTCLINKCCCICGKPADLHHVDRVGMGRDRTDICHEGMEALPLCRIHHTEAHAIPDSEFFDKYHLDGGIKLDKTLCKIYGLKRRKQNEPIKNR